MLNLSRILYNIYINKHKITNLLSTKNRLYCVGTAKSGTHSIAGIFDNKYKVAHEAESKMLINLILNYYSDRIEINKMKKYLIDRDKRLNLDVDSSQLNFFVLKLLLELFPNSKYILTIRDPYSQLDSIINHQLARTTTEHWTKMREFRFRPNKYTYSHNEIILKENGLYPLDGYLSYWTYHNLSVINIVPRDKLLIIRTDKISKSLEKIANFTNVPYNNLTYEKSHSYKASKKYNILDEINTDHLEYKIRKHCSYLINYYFTDFKHKTMNNKE